MVTFHGVVAVVTGLGESSVGDARGGLLCRQDRLGGGRSRSAGPCRWRTARIHGMERPGFGSVRVLAGKPIVSGWNSFSDLSRRHRATDHSPAASFSSEDSAFRR